MRILAAQLLALFLATLASGVATAQDALVFATEGEAFAKCQESRGKMDPKFAATCARVSASPRSYYRCEGKLSDGTPYTCGALVQFHNPPRPTGVASIFYYTNSCASGPDGNMRVNLSRTQAYANECFQNGCEYKLPDSPDECRVIEAGPMTPDVHVGYNCWYSGMKPTGRACDPKKPGDPPPPEPPNKCPEGQVRLPNGNCADRGECPVGQHMVSGKCVPDGACPAGKIKAPDSSCVDESCPEGQAKAKDGTCKPDDDGDGKPNDGEDTGKFSGGDDCKNPPQCSGDNILCGQARIQWRIDCNTRRNQTVSGGDACTAPPVCSGEKCSAMEFSQLLQQWRTACATEKLARGTTGTGDGQPEWTKVPGMSQDPGQGSTSGDTKIWAPTERVDGSKLDQTAWVGGGGTCPGFTSPSSGGSISSGFFAELASPPPAWCSYIGWVGLIFNLFALVSAIYILARP